MGSATKETAHTPWRQRLALLVLALAAVALLLATTEWLLGLLGMEGDNRYADPYVGFAASRSLFERVDGDPAMWRTRPEKLRFFNQQEFLVEKPKGALRVFTLGGSTTAGRPYDDHVSYSRWLERFLDQAEPDRSHEVINAGAISYASYRVARLMDELVRYQPDLFVVLTGHNEFLEERSYRDVRTQSPARRWIRSRLARLRLARLAWAVLDVKTFDQTHDGDSRTTLPADVKTRLEVWNGVQAYTRDDVQRDAVATHFAFNLDRMVDLAQERGVPILFVVPASNLKDFSPFKSEHGAGIPTADAAHIEALVAAQAPDPAELRAAVQADPLYAAGWFRLGQVELDRAETQTAREAFETARETDVAPLRAPKAIVQAVRDLATRRDLPVIDLPRLLEDELEAGAGHRILGAEHFLDHVHPTLEVHRRIAEEVLAWMAGAKLARGAGNPAARSEIFEEVISALDREYYARRDLNLAKVLGWAGKLEEAEAPLLRAREVLHDEPALHLALGTLWQKQGRDAEALPELQQAAEELPESPEARFNLAIVEARLGQADLAVRHFEAALSLRSDYPEAQFNLAQVLRHQGRFDEAIRGFEAAQARSPGETRVLRALAATYTEAGRLDAARLRFEALLTAAPETAEIHYILGRLEASAGDPEAAAASYAQALDLDPEHVLAHNNLGILLAGVGRWDEAVAHLRRATELDPVYAEAHLNLAVALDRSGRAEDAVQSARAALAIQPENARIQLALAMLLIEVGDRRGAEPHLQAARDAGLDIPESIAVP